MKKYIRKMSQLTVYLLYNGMRCMYVPSQETKGMIVDFRLDFYSCQATRNLRVALTFLTDPV